MPTVLRIHGFKFFFYANEGSEPPHVHVDKGDATGKMWLASRLWAYVRGFNQTQLRQIEAILQARQAELMERWNEFFSR